MAKTVFWIHRSDCIHWYVWKCFPHGRGGGQEGSFTGSGKASVPNLTIKIRKERRHVIGEFLKLHPERSNNWIAEDLGVAKETVDSVRKRLEAGCEISTLDTLLGKDGQQYPRRIERVGG